MKKTKKATSIVEAMIVMLVITTWVTWMYNIYNKSSDLSVWTTNKIQAIQIATQWIEWFTNIRDTNWLLFSSDYKNCWNTLNYNTSCIWVNDGTHDIDNTKSYKIYREADNRWMLSNTGTITSSEYANPSYRDFFKVWLENWIYTQTWVTDNLKPLFTREIKVQYLGYWDSSDPKMKVTSLVQWVDSSSTVPHKVEIDQILSNWKK
jgi:hypothetical protein